MAFLHSAAFQTMAALRLAGQLEKHMEYELRVKLTSPALVDDVQREELMEDVIDLLMDAFEVGDADLVEVK